jgi:hypothetical protein
MTPIDDEITFVPSGHRLNILMIAYVKHALTTLKMKAGERLHLLEKLNELADHYLTPEVIALIDPMPDPGIEMLRAAFSLDGDARFNASFDILTRDHVFLDFIRVNPSILAAIKLAAARTGQSYVL